MAWCISKDLKDITTTFLELADSVRGSTDDFIIDGEIVAMRGEAILPFAELQKRRAQIQKKLEAAKAAGKPTKNIEDALYEIDDELRLTGNAA